MTEESIFAYAHLNARILPMQRGERYEDPLEEALAENGLAEVTGAGTMQMESGEIEYCGIDIDIPESTLTQAIPFIAHFLAERGAPRGSRIEYTLHGEQRIEPFGFLEGFGIYLNGTDLPAEVYRNSDINYVIEEIERLIDDRGDIQGYWEGPTETALYVYGYDNTEMKTLIADFMASYPLCERARIVDVA